MATVADAVAALGDVGEDALCALDEFLLLEGDEEGGAGACGPPPQMAADPFAVGEEALQDERVATQVHSVVQASAPLDEDLRHLLAVDATDPLPLAMALLPQEGKDPDSDAVSDAGTTTSSASSARATASLPTAATISTAAGTSSTTTVAAAASAASKDGQHGKGRSSRKRKKPCLPSSTGAGASAAFEHAGPHQQRQHPLERTRARTGYTGESERTAPRTAEERAQDDLVRRILAGELTVADAAQEYVAKSVDPASLEGKRQRRLMRNRLSAQLHRERKKAYISGLEKEVSVLHNRVGYLETENAQLRATLARYEPAYLPASDQSDFGSSSDDEEAALSDASSTGALSPPRASGQLAARAVLCVMFAVCCFSGLSWMQQQPSTEHAPASVQLWADTGGSWNVLANDFPNMAAWARGKHVGVGGDPHLSVVSSASSTAHSASDSTMADTTGPAPLLSHHGRTLLNVGAVDDDDGGDGVGDGDGEPAAGRASDFSTGLVPLHNALTPTQTLHTDRRTHRNQIEESTTPSVAAFAQRLWAARAPRQLPPWSSQQLFALYDPQPARERRNASASPVPARSATAATRRGWVHGDGTAPSPQHALLQRLKLQRISAGASTHQQQQQQHADVPSVSVGDTSTAPPVRRSLRTAAADRRRQGNGQEAGPLTLYRGGRGGADARAEPPPLGRDAYAVILDTQSAPWRAQPGSSGTALQAPENSARASTADAGTDADGDLQGVHSNGDGDQNPHASASASTSATATATTPGTSFVVCSEASTLLDGNLVLVSDTARGGRWHQPGQPIVPTPPAHAQSAADAKAATGRHNHTAHADESEAAPSHGTRQQRQQKQPQRQPHEDDALHTKLQLLVPTSSVQWIVTPDGNGPEASASPSSGADDGVLRALSRVMAPIVPGEHTDTRFGSSAEQPLRGEQQQQQAWVEIDADVRNVRIVNKVAFG